MAEAETALQVRLHLGEFIAVDVAQLDAETAAQVHAPFPLVGGLPRRIDIETAVAPHEAGAAGPLQQRLISLEDRLQPSAHRRGAAGEQIGSAHVSTPLTNAHLVYH